MTSLPLLNRTRDDLTKRRVRLFRRHRANLQTNTLLLRAFFQHGRLALALLELASFADELIDRWHRVGCSKVKKVARYLHAIRESIEIRLILSRELGIMTAGFSCSLAGKLGRKVHVSSSAAVNLLRR